MRAYAIYQLEQLAALKDVYRLFTTSVYLLAHTSETK